MIAPLLTVALRTEHDVVVARQRARQVAKHLGFDDQDQVRIATAVSEIARNVIEYAREGQVEFGLEGRTSPQILAIRVIDKGPGIQELDLILAGRYQSKTGMGVGLTGARRLMDQFHIDSVPGLGTTILMRKFRPRHAAILRESALGPLVDLIALEGLQNPLAEVQYQNQELVRALDEIRRRQEDLTRVNRELDETNRGVVALYAELDEKAEHLRRADEMKTRFLSNMSHEFRTPLNSILAIGRLLERRSDGDLTPEQEKQVGFILKAASDLTEIVDDLLDIAKVEAGKIVVRPADFDLGRLFGALRGMLRPLLVTETVRLTFDEPVGIPRLYGDEGKVSQILRNLLSNAIKFTERGEVRVTAVLTAGGERISISVADTGIGIAPGDQARIFDEFGQVEHSMQRKLKGTGLGLALSKRLASVLGGSLGVESALGEGSTFTLDIPVSYAPRPSLPTESVETDDRRVGVLVVDDDMTVQHVYERVLRGTEFQPLPARSLRDAEAWLQTGRARAVVLDVQLFGEDSWQFLAELKARPGRGILPVIVVTNVGDEAKAMALGADAYSAQPVPPDWLLGMLRRLTKGRGRVLVVDDDPASRYVLGGLVGQLGFAADEAENGAEGARRALEEPPAALILDLVMPELNGHEVLRKLRADPGTEQLPIVVATSKALDDEERHALTSQGAVVVSKSSLAAYDAVDALAEALRSAGLPNVLVPPGAGGDRPDAAKGATE